MRQFRIAIIVAYWLLTACGGGASSAGPSSTDAGVTLISDVQGVGLASPLDGRTVTLTGIVTGDFQDNDADTSSNLGGFFLQDESPDTSTATSDGVFVYDGVNPGTAVGVGDKVRVTGSVTEYFGETQISASRVDVIGKGIIEATDIDLPTTSILTNSDGDAIADLERYEGMLVRFPDTLTVSGVHNLARFGEVTLSQGGRLYQFTNESRPSASGYRAHRERVAARSLLLDDGQRARDATPIRYLGETEPIRTGNTITGLTGNLRFSRGSGDSGVEAYRLMPIGQPRFETLNPRPQTPAVAGALRIASFNVWNFFSTIDTGRNICGPAADSNCRGADSRAEYDRQLAKIVTTIGMLDADIIGLVEIENNSRESLRAIVVALNASFGNDVYDYLQTGTIGNDTIKTGFLYRPASVSAVGAFAVLDSSVDARFNDVRNRPVLAQTFRVTSGDAALTVVVNHLKSKSSDCDSDGDPNRGDGQADCNRARTDAAAAIVRWLATDPTMSSDPDFLVIGDFNAYLEEDPIVAFEQAGFTNLIPATAGGEAYSFVFDSQSGALDHAFASPSLVAQVAGAIEWHINADESAAFDYNLERGRDPSLFDADMPYRSSDHDPLIIGLDLSN